MPGFDDDPEPLYVFVLDESYVFKRYFPLADLFDAISEHYDGDEYRFEVPAEEWAAVEDFLREYHFEPRGVDDAADFVVVKEQYTPHAAILRNSIAHWTRRGYEFFLMKDPLSVERAVQEHGATPVGETDMVAGL